MSLSDDPFPQDGFVKIVHYRHCLDDYNLIGRIRHYKPFLEKILRERNTHFV